MHKLVNTPSSLLGGVAPNQHFSSGSAIEQCLQVQLLEIFISKQNGKLKC